MQKTHFKKLVLKGLLTGLMASASLNAAETAQKKPATDTTLNKMEDADGGNYGYHLYSEEDLLLELTPEGVKQYNSLSPEGKRLARLVASQRCDKQNACKGLNACKTDTHECAGKGDCKGTGKCSFSDKNLAVKVVADKMAQKRNGALKK
ncbi:MAG: hypothetical protein WC222_06380 [Parachlamydiales bacterium]|jgi:hypothetical protein